MTMTQDRQTYVYKVNELASYLNVDVAKIYRLARSGQIPAFKVGQEWRFLRSRIDQWIIDQEKKHQKSDVKTG